MMDELLHEDLTWAVRCMPRRVKSVMQKHGSSVFIAGGYIRARVAGETPSDVDLFVSSKPKAREVALAIADGNEKAVHETPNALTIKGTGLTAQVIHRWVFSNPEECTKSFDFTIVQAAIWYEPQGNNGKGLWRSICSPRFYQDLAARRLVYTKPERNEDAGGSTLRILKYYQRGYRIPLDSMGAVLARLCMAVRWDGIVDEEDAAGIITGLLREVDPAIDPTHAAHMPSSTETGEDLDA